MIYPAGSVTTVVTVIEISSSGLNLTCTMQVRDPVGCTGVGLLADDITDIGAGTTCKKRFFDIKFDNPYK